jgi:hypothetical protein
MRTIFYFFEVVIILFAICATKIGICQSTDGQQTPPISTHKIIDDISPFIDEDTAIVCYVNLLAVKDCYKLADIAERLAKVESFHERVRYYFALTGQIIGKNTIDKYSEQFSVLTANNVTHTYIILNMRDLKFGAYFVFTDVQENSNKAKCIDKFFNENADGNDVKNKQSTWSVYEKNCMIVGGQNSVLARIATIYIEDEQLVQMLLIPQMCNAICGYYNLSLVDRKNYIRKRFETFKPVINKKFQQGIEEVNDCDFVKSIFLFPDSVVAWEFMHLKKMNVPLNQITFDFLKTTREYVAFGIDTNQPKIKLTVQCKTPEYAIKFKKFIDETWWNIVNNYFLFFFSKNIQSKHENDPEPMSPSNWADLFVSLLPKPDGNKLIIVVDQNCQNNFIKNDQ